MREGKEKSENGRRQRKRKRQKGRRKSKIKKERGRRKALHNSTIIPEPPQSKYPNRMENPIIIIKTTMMESKKGCNVETKQMNGKQIIGVGYY